MSTSPAISTPVKQISPSPIAACMSPTANMPPGWRTGKKIRAPAPWKWSSRLPPCCPARPFESSSPSVATPTTPTIGMAGNETRSFIFTMPSRTSKSRVTGDRTCSISCPKPGMSVATPHSIGRTSRISATSESPGSAPLTATGPVALLIRERSISVTRSSSLRIWPVKQSFVSKVTTSPGSTSSTGRRSGPNDQITSLRGRRWCCATLRCHRFVFDVDALHVAQLLRSRHRQPDRQRDADPDPRDRDPVRVLDRIGRDELVVLVIEREEEEHDPADRKHEVEEGVELGSPPDPVLPDRARADEHVHDDHDDHRERGDQGETDERAPLPTEQQRQHEGEDAHADDRVRRRPEPRVHVAERPRRQPVPGEGVEDSRGGVHRRVRVRCDRVTDRDEDEHPPGPPEDLAEIPPRVGAGGLRDEVAEAGAEDPGVRRQHVEEADREGRADDRERHGASGMLRLLAERRGGFEADEGEDREHHPAEDTAPTTEGVVRLERLDVELARVREQHPERERGEDGDLERAENHAGRGGEADVAIGEQEDDDRHQRHPDPPLPGVVPAQIGR